MAARRAPFRQANVHRAVKGAMAAGFKVGRIEVGPDGRIILVTAGDGEIEPASDFDRWKAVRDARAS